MTEAERIAAMEEVCQYLAAWAESNDGGELDAAVEGALYVLGIKPEEMV